MGRKVVLTIVCDICKNEVSGNGGLKGKLKVARKQWDLAFHPACLETLTKSAETITRKRTRSPANR